MREHPGVVFRDGPLGRRAGLVGGPDVWEVVRALRRSREQEPDLPDDRRLARVARNAGLNPSQVDEAVRYYADHPAEVDRMVAEADAADEAAGRAADRRRELLA